ncbi:hypothetical protein HW555_001085 [Spodoptera exigua]|uniref:G protein gamma domain-containing protein n=1 Tax=Spodoptera exigua TaxID=7107 RepID=A0A835GTF0_SPOEX|nr:hypothetical protein HW555_001085 [Spodoptera exigua]
MSPPSLEATPCFAFPSFPFTFNIGLSDTAVMDMMVSTLQQQRAVTEQLRREAAIKRVPVSVVVSDIVKYINEHEQEDCLLVGFSSQKVNPFREKSSCTVLHYLHFTTDYYVQYYKSQYLQDCLDPCLTTIPSLDPQAVRYGTSCAAAFQPSWQLVLCLLMRCHQFDQETLGTLAYLETIFHYHKRINSYIGSCLRLKCKYEGYRQVYKGGRGVTFGHSAARRAEINIVPPTDSPPQYSPLAAAHMTFAVEYSGRGRTSDPRLPRAHYGRHISATICVWIPQKQLHWKPIRNAQY